MLLCIDIGNTNIVMGVFDQSSGEVPVASWRVATALRPMADEYAVLLDNLLRLRKVAPAQITGVALSSGVPPLTGVFREICRDHLRCDPLLVDDQVKTGITVLYDKPSDVGPDRILNSVALYHELGGPGCIVDFGTGTTFDAVTAAGEYLGGAIAPGIEIAAEALFSRTSRLPRIELTAPPAAIGGNTVHAIQPGLILGYVSMVEGMVARFQHELGPGTRVIATGGLASVIAPLTTCLERVDPWLTLKGLRRVWHLNQ